MHLYLTQFLCVVSFLGLLVFQTISGVSRSIVKIELAIAAFVLLLYFIYIGWQRLTASVAQSKERRTCEQAERANPGTRATILSNGQVLLTDRRTGREVPTAL